MKIITEQENARESLARWFHQYPEGRDYTWYVWDVEKTRAALLKLKPETVTRKDLQDAGLNGWGTLECDECNEAVEVAVHLGEEPDYEARWWRLCKSCAARVIEQFPTTPPKDMSK